MTGTLLDGSQHRLAVLSRAPHGRFVYTVLRDGTVGRFDAHADYALDSEFEALPEDESPEFLRVLALSDEELVAADRELAYRFRVGEGAVVPFDIASEGRTRAPVQLVCAGRRVFASTGARLVALEAGGPDLVFEEDAITCLAAANHVLAVGRESGCVELRAADRPSDVLASFDALRAPVIALAVSRDGARVAAADDATRACVFTRSGASPMALAVPGKLSGIAFTEDDAWLVASALAGSVFTFACDTWALRAPTKAYPEGKGYLLASTLADDGTLLAGIEGIGLVRVSLLGT